MQTVKTLETFPHKTPIDAVQGKIVKLYKRELKDTTYGQKYKQDGVFRDASGEMKITAWEHPELDPLKDKEIVIHAGGGGKGLSVNRNEWNGKTTVSIEVGKQGQFQTVAVYTETKAPTQPDATPKAEDPRQQAPARNDGRKAIHGATAGLATNKAIDLLIAMGAFNLKTLESDIMAIGGAIARAALRLEAGEIQVVEEQKKDDVPF